MSLGRGAYERCRCTRHASARRIRHSRWRSWSARGTSRSVTRCWTVHSEVADECGRRRPDDRPGARRDRDSGRRAGRGPQPRRRRRTGCGDPWADTAFRLRVRRGDPGADTGFAGRIHPGGQRRADHQQRSSRPSTARDCRTRPRTRAARPTAAALSTALTLRDLRGRS